MSWERTCTSSTKSELYDVRLSGVEIAEGGLADLDAEGLRAAGELAGGEVRANIPSGKLNWVDPAAGVQHWFNKQDLAKRAEAVANAATAMADTPHRGERRPEGMMDGDTGKYVKRMPDDHWDQSHGAFIWECFQLLDADGDKKLIIDELQLWVRTLVPELDLTEELVKDLLVTMGREESPHFVEGPTAWHKFRFTWFEFQVRAPSEAQRGAVPGPEGPRAGGGPGPGSRAPPPRQW